jgi:hypothetical protein
VQPANRPDNGQRCNPYRGCTCCTCPGYTRLHPCCTSVARCAGDTNNRLDCPRAALCESPGASHVTSALAGLFASGPLRGIDDHEQGTSLADVAGDRGFCGGLGSGLAVSWKLPMSFPIVGLNVGRTVSAVLSHCNHWLGSGCHSAQRLFTRQMVAAKGPPAARPMPAAGQGHERRQWRSIAAGEVLQLRFSNENSLGLGRGCRPHPGCFQAFAYGSPDIRPKSTCWATAAYGR